MSGGGGRRKRVVKGEGGGVGGGDCVTVWEKDGDAWDGRLAVVVGGENVDVMPRAACVDNALGGGGR